MVSLMYGSGLRLMECLRLRNQDLDIAQRTIYIRSGKHNEDRLTLLAENIIPDLTVYLRKLRASHERELAQGSGRVYLPKAIEMHHPEASTQWEWQYVFPARKPSIDPQTGLEFRHHYYPKTLQAAIKSASRKSHIDKTVSCHTLRHTFAAQLLAKGHDIRKVQSLLGHSDLRSTQIYQPSTIKQGVVQ
jgi:site-specific recombinase XerD